mgnify:CR=1 FL=1
MKKKYHSFISVEVWKEGKTWKAIPAYNFNKDTSSPKDIKIILTCFYNFLWKHLDETLPFLLKTYNLEIRDKKIQSIKKRKREEK